MNVLVTGASGLVGNAVSKWLLDKQIHVSGVIHVTPACIEHPHFSQITTNLLETDLSAKSHFDCVIHCSAVVPSKNSKHSEETLYALNQKIDQSVFSFCTDREVKLIYISTAYIYDTISTHAFTEESTLKNNLTGYYKSKIDSEDFLTVSNRDYAILRLSSPYGDLQKQTNVVRTFSDKIRVGLPVTLLGRGERQQNFIHLDDISEACFLALTSTESGAYNLTYDRSYSMLELATYIKEIYASESPVLFAADKTEIQMNVNFDNSKIKQTLKWAPKMDLRTGLAKTLLH
jgi:nucleoside-diphosphate-sugar epimerase